MAIYNTLVFLIIAALILLAFLIKPIRKTIGLLLVILGALAGLTFLGLIIGIPMIIAGGLLLFI
jgi:hypothetical protein